MARLSSHIWLFEAAFAILLVLLVTYHYNVSTTDIATKRIEQIQEESELSHDGFYDIVKDADGAYRENLYYGPCDIRKAMQMFEDSEAHKKNLDNSYEELIVIMQPAEGDIPTSEEGWCNAVFIFKSDE